MAIDQTVAVLGAGGTMGQAMARNLATAGAHVRAWNRSAAKAEPLAADGAEICVTPAQAVRRAEVVLTMVADADAVTSTMEAAAQDLDQGSVWLQMSTIGETGTKRCAEFAHEHGLVFFDAPVLGTKQPAEQGQLVVLASGPAEQLGVVQPIFDAIGRKTIWAGEAGAGTKLKVVANSWVLTVTEGCAEMVALAQAMGVDPGLVLDAVSGGPLDLPYLHLKAKAIIGQDFAPSSPSSWRPKMPA